MIFTPNSTMAVISQEHLVASAIDTVDQLQIDVSSITFVIADPLPNSAAVD